MLTINGILLIAPFLVVLLKWYAIVCIYVILCATVANIGGKRLVGFWGTLVLSLILTPIVTLLLLIMLDRKRKRLPENTQIQQLSPKK